MTVAEQGLLSVFPTPRSFDSLFAHSFLRRQNQYRCIPISSLSIFVPEETSVLLEQRQSLAVDVTAAHAVAGD